MILIDTNVVSEAMRQRPDQANLGIELINPFDSR
jgi:predicted nucleic acid-binding protein